MPLHCMGVVYDSMTRVTPRPTCQISRDPATSASWEVLHRTRNIIWILYPRPHAQRPQQPHPHGQGAHFNGVVARTISVFSSCALCCRLHYFHRWLSSRILQLATNSVLQLKCWPHLAIQSSKRAKKKQFMHCNLSPFTVAYFNLMNNRQWAGWVSECIQVTLSQYQPPSVAVPPLLSWLSRRGGAGNCFIMQ